MYPVAVVTGNIAWVFKRKVMAAAIGAAASSILCTVTGCQSGDPPVVNAGTGEIAVETRLQYCSLDIPVLAVMAERGDSIAQYFASCKVLGSVFAPLGQHRVLGWLTSAAEGERLPAAQALLATKLRDGSLGPIDAPRAGRLAFEAANKGNERAQLMLVQMFATGDGMKKDRIEALKWAMIGAYRGGLDEEEVRAARSALSKPQQAEAVRRVFAWKRDYPLAYPLTIEQPVAAAVRASGVPIQTVSMHNGGSSTTKATRIGGAPWWPKGKPRPKCGRDHPMSFVAQVRLGDIPGERRARPGVLSFHYCLACRSFGKGDESPRGYDVSLLDDLGPTDGGPISGTPIAPRGVSL